MISLPADTTGALHPAPIFFFQTVRGPSFGQTVATPFSSEDPSRCGPRNCGQSSALADSSPRASSPALASVEILLMLLLLNMLLFLFSLPKVKTGIGFFCVLLIQSVFRAAAQQAK